MMTERETELLKLLAQRDLRIEQLKEELSLARHHLFGRTSEKAVVENLPLFDEVVPGIAEKPSELQTIEVGAHLRAKKTGRKPLPDTLPRTDIIHDLPDAEKICACGCNLVRIGEEVSERLALVPRRLYVERHIRPKYACHHCEGSGDEDKPAVRTAPVPPSIIPRSIVTPSLLASILVAKYVDHLPFYRQEEQFSRSGLDLSRQDMSNWSMKLSQAVIPLGELLKKSLLSSSFIQMDETPLQVLGEPDRSDTAKSYMWLARGGPPGKEVVLFRYQPTRSAKYPTEFLVDFHGHLQTDGYEAYATAIAGKDIVHVGCWAHARRKFDEAAKANKQSTVAPEGLKKIRRLYHIERELREELAAGKLNPELFVTQRREQLEPILADLKTWLLDQSAKVLPSSLTGKAIAYSLGQWDKLVHYLDLPELTPDNNGAENAIRPFVLGRKNWLFSGSPAGADASCAIYTLIETAKANGLKPWDYLLKLCTELPVTPLGKLSSLLPFA
jgi:transposase